MSPRTVQYVHSILLRALEDARREELVGRNVALEVSPPRFERREFTPLSSAEARVLLAAAADDRLYGVYVLALVLGMRRGEVLGCGGRLLTSTVARCGCGHRCSGSGVSWCSRRPRRGGRGG